MRTHRRRSRQRRRRRRNHFSIYTRDPRVVVDGAGAGGQCLKIKTGDLWTRDCCTTDDDACQRRQHVRHDDPASGRRGSTAVYDCNIIIVKYCATAAIPAAYYNTVYYNHRSLGARN